MIYYLNFARATYLTWKTEKRLMADPTLTFIKDSSKSHYLMLLRTEYVVFNNKKYTIHSKKYQRPTPIK